ncbi:MAG: iron-sulfur cluster insertion protein ErpA, partial [Candidatus Competibacteraceae bacterium]
MNATVENFTPADSPLLFTDDAALKVKGLLEEEQNPNLMLRVFISGG